MTSVTSSTSMLRLTNVMAHIYTHHHKPRFSVRWICGVVVECALGCQEHVDMHMHGHGSCRSVLGIMPTLPMFFLAGNAASTSLKMQKASNGETSILKSFSPGIDLTILVRMNPQRLARSLSSLVILAQHSCVMSRHVTSWCVSYVVQFFHLHFVTCVMDS